MGQKMIKQICITAALITTLAATHAWADHKHGPRSECWRDTKYNKHWAYYYCGAQAAKCDGKKSKGHDTVFWQYHGDHFRFKTHPYETYWCCGGTKEAEGKYFLSDTWIVETKTERISVAGGTCNKLIQKDVCGDTHEVMCTTPDQCNAGLILRNGECIKPCGENEVFTSPQSNTCIKCEPTIHQGPTLDRQSCIKCDEATEFFNRQTKTCVKKSSLNRYSKDAIKECWRCPLELHLKCVQAITEVNKMGLTGAARISNINELAALNGGPENIAEACGLE